MPTSTTPRIIETRWYGVYLVTEGGHWWLQTDSGCDDYCGTTRPTALTIAHYAATTADIG